jgi:putative ABC transport system permease protein
VGDVRGTSLDVQGPGQFYVPEPQWMWADKDAILVVRTAGAPASRAHEISTVAAAVDATLPVSRVETMQQLAASSVAQRRLAMLLFAAFAAVALILAIGGIYGLLAASVAARRREIGVRTALGAGPGQILALVMVEGFRLAAIGTVLGALSAFASIRFLRSLLFGVQPLDPLTLLCVGAILALVTLIACSVPATRALRISPVSALRSE